MSGYINLTVSTVAPDSFTSAVQIGEARTSVYVLIPGLSTACVHEVYGSADGVTYGKVCQPSINSSTVTTNPYFIASNTTGLWVPIPGDFPYIKIHQTSPASISTSYLIICK